MVIYNVGLQITEIEYSDQSALWDRIWDKQRHMYDLLLRYSSCFLDRFTQISCCYCVYLFCVCLICACACKQDIHEFQSLNVSGLLVHVLMKILNRSRDSCEYI